RSVGFCRYCGDPNDSGWIKCWTCGTHISPASKFCYKCGADQKDQRAMGLIDGRWARQDEDVALKIDAADLDGFLKKGLDIEQGTEAALFQHGKLVGVVGPGRYTADSVFKRLTPLAKVPTTILLYDASDHEITVETDGLRTADGLQVSATYKVVVRITDAGGFAENLFKGRRTLKLPALAGRISDDLRGALKGAVAGKKLDEVFESPDFRKTTEEALRAAVNPVVGRYGMHLAQLAFIDFFSAEYEALADKKGELARAIKEGDVDIERLKLQQRLRHAMTQERMDGFSSEKDFEDFVRQTEHELGMKDVIREDEMVRLKQEFGRKREKETLLHQIEVQKSKIELRRSAKVTEREESLADAEAEVEARKVRHDADIQEAKDAQDLSRRAMEAAREHEEAQMRARREDERERLAIRSKASAEALLSITDGPAAERLARLAELERKQKLSPEQLFAMAAAADPETARAYAREKGIKNYDEALAKQEKLHEQNADRMERIMRTAMEQMGRVAGPERGAPYPGGARARPCTKCSGMVASGMAYCPHCGNKVG
ncbi:MAG: SPFH domain-containing protein, partial [Planctomycetota bacterium]